jgi:hypothetical protein
MPDNLLLSIPYLGAGKYGKVVVCRNKLHVTDCGNKYCVIRYRNKRYN